MPQRDPLAYLWDALESARHVRRFVEGKGYDDYRDDLLLRSAVERQLSIVGEALAQLRRYAPDMAGRIAHAREIVAFRNRLVHGYAAIDDAVVWGIVEDDLGALIEELEALLTKLEG